LEPPTCFGWRWWHYSLPLLLAPVDAKEKKGKERKDKKIKARKHKGVLLCPNKGPSFYVCLCVTFKFQGLSHVWVQFPKEFYTNNRYKNIKIAR
jgi:hypothetical protein